MLIKCHGGTQVEYKEERGHGGKFHLVGVELADVRVLWGKRI